MGRRLSTLGKQPATSAKSPEVIIRYASHALGLDCQKCVARVQLFHLFAAIVH